jgi:hypothetical protein
LLTQAPLTVVLGELDDDHHHKHLNRSEGAMEQGPHRLARGRHFYEATRPAPARPSTFLTHSAQPAACIAQATTALPPFLLCRDRLITEDEAFPPPFNLIASSRSHFAENFAEACCGAARTPARVPPAWRRGVGPA